MALSTEISMGLQAPPSRPFRILQLTDFHSDVSEAKNEATREQVRAMIARYRPDFLALTGDIWCGDVQPDAAPMWMKRDLQFLGSLGVPWAFTWGNHDYAVDIHQAWRRLMQTPYYQPPECFEDHHQRFTLKPRGASDPTWDIYFLNSGLQWSMPDDLAWFKKETLRLREMRGRFLPALLFFHIPLKCYQDAVDRGNYHGFALEEVACWGDEAGLGADILKETGEVQACFCGHSHRCDFHFEEGGITFAFGRVTGHGGYGHDVPRGAKLIALDPLGEQVTFETVF